MKSTEIIAIAIVFIVLTMAGTGKESRGWSTQGNDADGLNSTCTNQEDHNVKLSVYGGNQCLAFILT